MKRLLVILSLTVLCGCNPNSRGFVLPPGDIDSGKLTFKQLECTQCHSVGEIAWEGGGDDPEVELGGAVTTLKTYGEPVTAVINPSHRIARPYMGEQVAIDGESRMRRYNEVMTVEQLVDIVSYLQTEYELVVPTNPYLYRSW
jgi:sulfur-oxidizing protein SoxX